ncbi:HPr(Ser) kinase/phosphatase, partial [Candidatus Proelusimicrobium excrementi]|uniref:HPr(Ser) kinase/phosphatase n=1 Tax=Candidatus Proelusimicrobium excrementi TaxID=3416222 RepID=UPI003D13AE67
MNSYSVLLKKVVEDFNLTIVHASTDYDTVRVMVEEVARPGLPIAGFFNHFESMRLQIIGNVESAYLKTLTPERRMEIYDQLFSYKIPALIFARNMEPSEQCLEMAKKHDITILRCVESTTYLLSSMIAYLKNALAPRISRHGVLVEVYGEGLLLMGESGIGKSEAAAELLKRGHRLIADDAVDIRKIADNTLMGSSPELIRNYIEIRGIGVINVAKLFGMAAIKKETAINLVINIVPWSAEHVYDRLGLEEQYMDLLGVKV